MYRITFLLFILISWNLLTAQELTPTIKELQERYIDYREDNITQKRFTIEDLIPVFNRHNATSKINFSVKAHSLARRPIYLAQYGQGATPILFWSQMHGNESTATMALLDLFNFLESDRPEDQDFLLTLSQHFTLYLIPMLNPDGAANFVRRNAANIDLNRDALDLSNPESRLLKKVRDSLDPVFGFNLHDQNIYYRAGMDGHQVALAFLAPAFDYEKNINGVRMKSMQLISIMRDSLQSLIPGRIGVYDDSFEPRAFGDNIQRWGTSTILIESGGYPNDPEKQYLRQLNFITLIKALGSMMSGSYEAKTIAEYQAIPQNDQKLMSLILRDINVPIEGQKIKMDVGFQHGEQLINGKTYYPSTITDVGDLSIYNGFKEFDATGFQVQSGKWHPHQFESLEEFKKSNWQEMLQNGFLGFVIKTKIPGNFIPTVIVANKKPLQKVDPLNLELAPGRNPTFILEKQGRSWIVHNGNIYTEDQYIKEIEKTLRAN